MHINKCMRLYGNLCNLKLVQIMWRIEKIKSRGSIV